MREKKERKKTEKEIKSHVRIKRIYIYENRTRQYASRSNVSLVYVSYPESMYKKWAVSTKRASFLSVEQTEIRTIANQKRKKNRSLPRIELYLLYILTWFERYKEYKKSKQNWKKHVEQMKERRHVLKGVPSNRKARNPSKGFLLLLLPRFPPLLFLLSYYYYSSSLTNWCCCYCCCTGLFHGSDKDEKYWKRIE